MTRDEVCSKFLESLPYTLYPFQEEALLAWFASEAGVLIAAPTGMGKTLIAEAAVFEALHTGQRLYYTTPLIALTDQKFRDFQELAERWGFRRDDVGLITGNRRVNPEAPVRVVVAEILLNHLIAEDPAIADMEHVGAVVMDEFHSFNDFERGVVWELSLVLLPKHVRVMLLSATVGNPYDFAYWLEKKHGRKLDVVITQERRVPLEYHWVEDKLLHEHLVQMVSSNDSENRTPALVFAFNRDDCWELAEKLKGLALVSNKQKQEIEAVLAERQADLAEGVGPKLKQMLLRGVGVHHAGVLPRHKEIVEDLFERKLVPFVCCTETLAAGINLPARSVVLVTLLKGKHGEKKLIPASSAHQMFGRAGRPQFDKQGYVYAVAHDDDVKINKWRKKYDQIPAQTKDPGLLRVKKDLERKRPTRRKSEQYWSEGQFKTLIAAGPASLSSRSMIPYQVLLYLLTRTGTLHETRDFLSKRFNSPDRIEKFQAQLNFMLDNLQALGYLKRSEDGDHVTLDESIRKLLNFRSVDPLYGAFAAEMLNFSNFTEKVLVLESVLPLPPPVLRKVPIPEDLPKGPLQSQVLEPQLIAMGVKLTGPEPDEDAPPEKPRWMRASWELNDEEERPPTFPEMLPIIFQTRLAAPEPVMVEPKWVAGGTFELDCEFFKFVRSRDLIKQEGLILRHLLRLVILAGEFQMLTQDPEYEEIAEQTTRCCRRVDERYTERFLAEAESMRASALAKG
ncbi:MAG: DEAD/DEAH box helicase [Phycisphaerae bacterium]|jgi:superfamily II DNA/RNA helicase|nr:DEAD/DEAH box helicase [Phycisphaerae bacterium]HPC22899.1 DEAD/DEAH box helicase [Phycisphaerae bacterium]HRS27615.1 DEAD/DEAH box helicase [Phycisphaerae bacterium]HRT41885.1 DEAD/DEAH box helicase [Phycisphaerae bacterium]